nr:hypothetical protein [Lachnospiraceae bacterium]
MKNVSCSSRRAVAFLMALVMVISILTPFHFTKEVLAYTVLSENDVDISNLVLTIGGTDYSAGGNNDSIQVNNGDAVKLSFNWNVNNSNVTNVTEDIQIAIDLDLQGLTLDQTVNSDDNSSIIPYTDEKGVNMGYYSIVDNIMSLYIYADYWNTYSNRSGKASLDGKVVVTSDGKTSQVNQTVSVDGSEIIDLIVNVDVVASTLSGNKEKTAITANADGSAIASFKYTMTANNGTVRNISLTDTPSGLNDTSSITLNYNGSSTTYTSWSALNSALASMQLSTTDSNYPASAYITYDMLIPATSYDPSASTSVTNQMKASYNDDVNTDPQTTSTTLYNIITKPSVNKSGSLSGELVTWNITINPGDLGEDSIDWSSLTDTYSEAISSSYDQNITLTKDMFTKNSDGTYTYTYVTTVSEESLSSTTAEAINNTTSIDIGHYTYSKSTSVNTNPGSVTKTLTSTDGPDASGYLTWTVSIPIPDTTETIKNFNVMDVTYAENGGTHLLYDSDHPLYVYIGSNSPTYSVATTGQYANYTNYTTNSNGTIIYTEGIISDNSSYGQNTETFTLTESYVNAHKGETLTITYKSFSNDTTTAGKTYVNMVTSSYKIGDNTVTHSSQASWTDETVALTYKKGTPGSNETITYSLGTALSYFGDELTAGGTVTIVDTLPEGLTYQSLVGGWICSYNQYYQAKANDMTLTEGTDYTVNVAGQVVTFTLTLTDEMIAEIQEYTGTSDNTQGKGFYVEFIAEISDHVAYTTAQSFTNSAKGTYGSTNLDTAKVINTIEPVDILEKTHKFSSYKKGILSFTVDINPLELNLDNKDNVIEAVDQLGSKLILLENTLRVYTVDDSGNKTQITSGWSYTYNYDTGTITFSLPDETHLYITYDTQMDIPEGAEVTFDTGGNTFTIDGVASTDTSDQFSGEAFIVTYDSSVVGYGETGSLTIYKYWINVAGTEIPLSGSSFSIYYASVDKTDSNDPKLTYDPNSTPIYTSTAESSSADSNGISTTVDGNTIIINGLRLDNAFALVEADAPEGFEVSDTVRYFLLRGNDYGSLDADLITALKNYGNIYFGEQSLLLFENEPSASATLPLYASKKLDDLLSIPSTYVSRFGFTVEQYDSLSNAMSGTSGSEVATGTVDTKGDITFSPTELTFDETGTYYLKITEDDITHAKTASEVKKDSTYYIVEVLVSESTTNGVTTKKATIQKVSHYDEDDNLLSDSLSKAFTSVVFTNERNFTTTLSVEAEKFFNYTSVVPSGAFNFTIAPLSYTGNPSEDGYWAVDSYTEGSSLTLLEGTFSDSGTLTLSGNSVNATVDSTNATTATASDTGAIVWEDVFSYNSLTIGDEGSFNYIIYETDPASAYASSVTVDSSFYILHVDVARNAADNNYDVTYSLYYYQSATNNAQTLTYLGTTRASSVTLTADDNNRVSLGGSSIDFYNTSKEATLDFYVQKDLDGNSSWTSGKTFTAKVTQVSGMGSVTNGVLKEAATITDNAISFDDLSFDGTSGTQTATATFTSAGTYYFRIAETIGSDEDIVYDDTIYYATVEVSLDSSTGALTPEITAMTQYVTTNGKTMAVDYLSTYQGNATDGAVILYNKTAYKTGVFFEAKKTLNSDIPGDFTFNFGLTNLGNNNWSDANAVVDAFNTALASSGDVASAITSLASYESNISTNSTTYKFGTLRTNAATNDSNGNITFGSSTSPAITYTSTEVDGIGATTATQYLVMRESDLPSALASNVTKDENLILVEVDLSRTTDALTATKTYYLLTYNENSNSYSLGASNTEAQTFNNTSKDGSTTLDLHKLLNGSASLGDRSFTMKVVQASDATGTSTESTGILTKNNNGGDTNGVISVTLDANTINTENATATLTFTTENPGTYYFKIYEDDTNGDSLLEYDSNYYVLTVNVGVQSYYDTNHNVNSDAGKIVVTK